MRSLWKQLLGLQTNIYAEAPVQSQDYIRSIGEKENCPHGGISQDSSID